MHAEPRELPGKRNGRRVGPVHVFDCDDERARSRGGVHPRRERTVELPPERFGFEARDGRALGQREPEQVCKEWHVVAGLE